MLRPVQRGSIGAVDAGVLGVDALEGETKRDPDDAAPESKWEQALRSIGLRTALRTLAPSWQPKDDLPLAAVEDSEDERRPVTVEAGSRRTEAVEDGGDRAWDRVRHRAVSGAVSVGYRALNPVREFATKRLSEQMWLDVNHLDVALGATASHVAAIVHATSQMEAAMARLEVRLEVLDRRVLEAAAQNISEMQWVASSLGAEVRSGRDRTGAALADALTQLNRIESLAGSLARRVAVPVATDELLIRTSVGYVLCDASDASLIAILIDVGEIEPGTRRLIERILQPGDVFVDAGANIGMHTLCAADAVGPTGRVEAFEPFEQTAGLLQRSVRLNGAQDVVEVHIKGLTDHVGRETFFLGHTSGHHSLMDHRIGGNDHSQRCEVDVTTLDEVLRDRPHVDLLKIDVEGAELQVLRGAEETLEQNPAIGIIAEFGPIHVKSSGSTHTEWFGAFEDRGFRWKTIDATTGQLDDAGVDDLRDIDSVNVLFAREDSVVWSRSISQ